MRNIVGGTEDLIVTNFGLDPDLRCLVALKKTAYAFGKLDRTLSERATFAFSGRTSSGTNTAHVATLCCVLKELGQLRWNMRADCSLYSSFWYA